MEMMNGYLQVKPLKREGAVFESGNEYIVITAYAGESGFEAGLTTFGVQPGDIVIAEAEEVRKLDVNGEECYFVKEEFVYARIPVSEKNNRFGPEAGA